MRQFSSNMIRLRAETREPAALRSSQARLRGMAMVGPTCRMRHHKVRAFEGQSCSDMQCRSLEQKEWNHLPQFSNKRRSQTEFGLQIVVSNLAVTHRPDYR